MALLDNTNAYINDYELHPNLLGYLPLLDHNRSYYSWKNEIESPFEYVTPVIWRVDDTFMSDKETFYAQEPLYEKCRHDLKEDYENNRDEFLENFKNNKFILFFFGCDDGSYMMRFKDELEARDFLSGIDWFDEVIFHKNAMLY